MIKATRQALAQELTRRLLIAQKPAILAAVIVFQIFRRGNVLNKNAESTTEREIITEISEHHKKAPKGKQAAGKRRGNAILTGEEQARKSHFYMQGEKTMRAKFKSECGGIKRRPLLTENETSNNFLIKQTKNSLIRKLLIIMHRKCKRAGRANNDH